MRYGSWDYHKGVSYDKELQKNRKCAFSVLGCYHKGVRDNKKPQKNRKYALWFFGIITKKTQATKSRKEAQTIFDNIFNYYKTTFRLWNTSLF